MKTQHSTRRPDGLLAKLAASRFLTTSLLIHLLLISMMGGAVLFKAAQEVSSFEVAYEGTILQQADAEETEPGTDAEAEFSGPSNMQIEPVPIVPPVQSAIAALSAPDTSWTSTASFERMSIGGSNTPLAKPPQLSIAAAPDTETTDVQKSGKLRSRSSFTFFGIQAESQCVAFLMDVSGSMTTKDKGGPEAYADLKEKLITLVDGLEESTEFNVIMFGIQAEVFRPKSVPATTANVTELRSWLAPYMRDKTGIRMPNYKKSHFKEAWGTTRLDIALTAALEMEADTLFILTDGTPQVGNADVLRNWEELKKKNSSRFERYAKELEEYKTRHKDDFENAQRKAMEMNQSLEGRTREAYWWPDFAKKAPPPPPGFYKPNGGATAEAFNTLIREMYQLAYTPKGRPMPSINIVGYHVSKESEDFLKDITKGIAGKYKTFKR